MPLCCVGLSHRTASLDLRERAALSAAERLGLLAAPWLRDGARAGGVAEIALLSTCNRVELYAAADSPATDLEAPPSQLTELLTRIYPVTAEALGPALYVKTGSEALRHLCSVAAGLDSMVLGEAEVLGQVAEAYAEAVQAGAAGAILGAAFRAAVRAGRRARAETAVGRLPAGLASEAVRLLRNRLPGFASGTFVVVGTGKMARIAAEVLHAEGARSITIVGRTLARARELGLGLGATPAPWHELARALAGADAVVSVTAAPHAVVTRELVESVLPLRAPDRRLVFVDLAVPRDVEPSVSGLPAIERFDLDDLQARIAANLGERAREVPRVREIIDQEVAQFEVWRQGARLRPLLASLHTRADQIRRRELERALARMAPVDAATRRQLELFSRALVGKLLDLPSRRLRSETDVATARAWASTVRALFGLDGADSTRDLETEPWPH